MLDRLVGLETEYAIRFSPRDLKARFSNRTLYQAVREAMGRLVRARNARGFDGLTGTRDQFFVENGGAFYYESVPLAPDGGLIEGATPECRGPSQLMLYQRAQERLLLRSLRAALASGTIDGDVGLLKNCRDAEGHVYGAQENFECDIARGLALWLLRGCCAGLLPWAFTVLASALLAAAALGISLLFLSLALFACAALAGRALALLSLGRIDPTERLDRVASGFERRLEALGEPGHRDAEPSWPARALYAVDYVTTQLIYRPYAAVYRALAFRRIRRHALAFLVSRPIISGTGTIDSEGRFGLSEKAPAILRPFRSDARPSGFAVFDSGNLIKQVVRVCFGGSPRRMFARRQRLQLGLADANMAQAAEFLKIGATTLVLDLVESGRVNDAPRLRRPIAALHAIAADPTLSVRVELVDGSTVTALALQRYYLERAAAYVREASVSSMEARDVVRLWREALDALESDPGTLVGRLDWVSKRFLLETCEPPPGTDRGAFWKKIDLRYGELGSGYFAQLEHTGEFPTLVSDDEIERAMRCPPENTAAALRGRIIKELADSSARVTVTWDSVRIGSPLGGKVIHLSDYR
jgi:Pup amidohydrolase